MEEPIKKRGRKKIIIIPQQTVETNEEPIKKKRGRKKKWETTPFKNNYNSEGTDAVTFEEADNINTNMYNTNNLNFGNLCIKVHDKEVEQTSNLKNYFTNIKETCDIYLSSDEEDTCNAKKIYPKI